MTVLSDHMTTEQVVAHIGRKDLDALHHLEAGRVRSDSAHASAVIRVHIGDTARTYTTAVRKLALMGAAQRDGLQWSLTPAGVIILRRMRGQR